MNTQQVCTESGGKQGKNLTEEARLAEMRRLYEEERRTLAEVGEAFGVSRQRVHQIFVKAGVTRRRGYANEIVPAAVLAETRRLYEEEVFSIGKIAERFGIPVSAARHRLIKAGVRISRWNRPKKRIDGEMLHALYVRKRLSLASIEKRIGVGRNIVAREMARHGIPTRPRYLRKAATQGGRI